MKGCYILRREREKGSYRYNQGDNSFGVKPQCSYLHIKKACMYIKNNSYIRLIVIGLGTPSSFSTSKKTSFLSKLHMQFAILSLHICYALHVIASLLPSDLYAPEKNDCQIFLQSE